MHSSHFSSSEENKNKSPDAKPSSCKSNAKKSSNDIARYAKTPDTEQVHPTPLNGEDEESAMLELLRWKPEGMCEDSPTDPGAISIVQVSGKQEQKSSNPVRSILRLTFGLEQCFLFAFLVFNALYIFI